MKNTNKINKYLLDQTSNSTVILIYFEKFHTSKLYNPWATCFLESTPDLFLGDLAEFQSAYYTINYRN